MSNKSKRRKADALRERVATLRTRRRDEHAATHPNRSILEVIRNFDGGNGMTPARAVQAPKKVLDAFGEEVEDYWRTWEPPDYSDKLTVYSGSPISGTRDGKPAIQDLLASLLYYPRASVPDPLSEYFERDRDHLPDLPNGPRGLHPTAIFPTTSEYQAGLVSYWKQDDANARRHGLAGNLRAYQAVESLLESGIVVPVAPWKLVRQHQASIAEAMIQDFEDDEVFELVRNQMLSTNPFLISGGPGSSVQVSGFTPAQLRELQVAAPSFYFHKLITIASATGARYVPRYGGDSEYLKLRLDKALSAVRSPVETRVLRDLTSLRVPELTNLNPETLVGIRENEEAFESFRSELNTLFTTAVSIPDQETFPSALSDYLNDHLNQRIAEVRGLVGRSSVFSGVARAGGFNLAIGTAGALGAPVMAELTGNSGLSTAFVLAGLTAAGAQAVVAMIAAARGRSPVKGADLIFAGLIAAPKD